LLPLTYTDHYRQAYAQSCQVIVLSCLHQPMAGHRMLLVLCRMWAMVCLGQLSIIILTLLLVMICLGLLLIIIVLLLLYTLSPQAWPLVLVWCLRCYLKDK